MHRYISKFNNSSLNWSSGFVDSFMAVVSFGCYLFSFICNFLSCSFGSFFRIVTSVMGHVRWCWNNIFRTWFDSSFLSFFCNVSNGLLSGFDWILTSFLCLSSSHFHNLFGSHSSCFDGGIVLGVRMFQSMNSSFCRFSSISDSGSFCFCFIMHCCYCFFHCLINIVALLFGNFCYSLNSFLWTRFDTSFLSLLHDAFSSLFGGFNWILTSFLRLSGSHFNNLFRTCNICFNNSIMLWNSSFSRLMCWFNSMLVCLFRNSFGCIFSCFRWISALFLGLSSSCFHNLFRCCVFMNRRDKFLGLDSFIMLNGSIGLRNSVNFITSVIFSKLSSGMSSWNCCCFIDIFSF